MGNTKSVQSRLSVLLRAADCYGSVVPDVFDSVRSRQNGNTHCIFWQIRAYGNKNQKIQLWLLNEIGFRRDYLKSSLGDNVLSYKHKHHLRI